MNYGISTDLNNDVRFFPPSHTNHTTDFIVGCYWLSFNRSYLLSDCSIATTVECTVCFHTFQRQEWLQFATQYYVVLQGVICVSGCDFTGRQRAVSSPVQMSFFPSGQLRFSGPQKYSK